MKARGSHTSNFKPSKPWRCFHFLATTCCQARASLERRETKTPPGLVCACEQGLLLWGPRGNVPAKLGHEFRKAKNSGTQRWYSPLSPCRRRFCMERQVEMLQSTMRIAEKNATVIQGKLAAIGLVRICFSRSSWPGWRCLCAESHSRWSDGG